MVGVESHSLLGDEECVPSGAAGEARAKQKGREVRKGKDAHEG